VNCRNPLREAQVFELIQDQGLQNQYRQLQEAERVGRAAQQAAGLTWEKRKMIWNGSNMQACPECHTIIQKQSGCNHMTCQPGAGGCGHNFCWVCLDPRPSYHGHHCNLFAVAKAQLNRIHPVRGIIGALVVAAAAYGAYRLHKYLNAPKPMPVKDLKTATEDLLKEASRCKRLAENGTYTTGTFKLYYLNEIKNKSFEDLDETQMTQLENRVDRFEFCLMAGKYEQEYAGFVKFMVGFGEQVEPRVAQTKPAVKQKPVPVPQQIAVKQTQEKKIATTKAVAKPLIKKRGAPRKRPVKKNK